MEHNKSFISERAKVVEKWEDFLLKHLILCNSNEYDETTNPEGYTNLGVSANNLCRDVILPRLENHSIWSCNHDMLNYQEGYGTNRLRKALAVVITKFFDTSEIINPEDLFCTVGVTSAIDLVSHCLADSGDIFLVPTPVYARVYTDMLQRSGVLLYPIPIITEDNIDSSPVLTLEKIKTAYRNAISEKRIVRGIFLINPNNPLGDVYSPQLLMDILIFCKEHKIHAIVDEVYGLSVFPGGREFHSVLKFPHLPDVNRTTVLYGLSKDFGVAGLRIGVIHTKCKVFQNCLRQLTFFSNIPFTVMDTTARFLEDIEWCQEYVSVNRRRLSEKYQYCVNRLEEMGLRVRHSDSGFFVWVDFRPICGSTSFKQERHFFNYLLQEFHLYIIPGKEFRCAQPGWFRVTFTYYPNHVVEGLNRLEKAINCYKPIDVEKRSDKN